MTYPPQQPDNQPENGPGPGPVGGPQQPGYAGPPQGQPGHGATQAGQQPGYGPPPGYTPEPPPKKRTGLIIGVVAAVVVVLVVAGVLVAVIAGSSSSTDNARSAGDTFMSGIQAQNIDQVRSVACTKNAEKLAGTKGAMLPADVKLDKFSYDLLSDDTTDDSRHTMIYKADVAATIRGKEKTTTTIFKLDVVKEDGSWKVCDMDND